MHRDLLACAVLFVCCLATAAPRASPDRQQAQLEKFIADGQGECEKQRTQMLSEMASSAPSDLVTAMDLASWTDYCPCMTDIVRTMMTPEFIRHAKPEEAFGVGRLAGAICAVRQIKAMFPPTCARTVRYLQEKQRSAGLDPAPLPDLCKCLQVEVDKLTPGNVEPETQTVFAAWDDYKHTGQWPVTEGPSLYASMRRCTVGGEPQPMQRPGQPVELPGAGRRGQP